jgi:hypothetical protein
MADRYATMSEAEIDAWMQSPEYHMLWNELIERSRAGRPATQRRIEHER